MAGLLMKYFVLKPEGDDVYASASRAGMRAYANIIREKNPTLSDDLRAWADREQVETIRAPEVRGDEMSATADRPSK